MPIVYLGLEIFFLRSSVSVNVLDDVWACLDMPGLMPLCYRYVLMRVLHMIILSL